MTRHNLSSLNCKNETLNTMPSFESFDKDYIRDMIYIYEKQFNITFNPKQKECIYKLFSSSWKLYTICGYAGTGKSEITLFINYVLSKHNDTKVLFCTPTNSQYSIKFPRRRKKFIYTFFLFRIECNIKLFFINIYHISYIIFIKRFKGRHSI